MTFIDNEEIVQRAQSRIAVQEMRDAITWLWAERMALAVMKKRIGAPVDLYAGVIHNVGNLSAIINFLDKISKLPCKCRSIAEEGNKDDDDWYWQDTELDHDSGCISVGARILLMKLKSGDISES
mgnify:CR=1 FL=1